MPVVSGRLVLYAMRLESASSYYFIVNSYEVAVCSNFD